MTRAPSMRHILRNLTVILLVDHTNPNLPEPGWWISRGYSFHVFVLHVNLNLQKQK